MTVPPSKTPSRLERARSFLLYAFGISILLHVFLGPLIVRWRQPDLTPREEVVSKVQIERPIAMVVPTPSPPPTPRPTPIPTPTQQPTHPPTPTPQPTREPAVASKPKPAKRLAIKPPETHAQATNAPVEPAAPPAQGSTNGVPGGTGSGTAPGNGSGTGNGNGNGSGTGTGTGVGSATPMPTKPACANPEVPAKTITAVAPDTPEIAREQGITGNVEVKVDLNEKSQITGVSIYKSANHLLDKAALDAARASKFQTAIENCQPIASSYRFVVEFQSE